MKRAPLLIGGPLGVWMVLLGLASPAALAQSATPPPPSVATLPASPAEPGPVPVPAIPPIVSTRAKARQRLGIACLRQNGAIGPTRGCGCFADAIASSDMTLRQLTYAVLMAERRPAEAVAYLRQGTAMQQDLMLAANQTALAAMAARCR